MIAFDTDVLSLILRGHPTYVARAKQIPPLQQAIPIVVIEEMMRGRLATIRSAETGKTKVTLEKAYQLFSLTFAATRQLQILPFSVAAEKLVAQWRAEKIRVGTKDMRIAAICIDRGALLITRNRRDFSKIPDLQVSYWEIEA